MGGVSKIFIIKGSTGEFDSYHTWNVSCYQDYTIASIVARHAQDEADRIFNNFNKDNATFYDSSIHGTNIYDPLMSIDYNGVKYCIQEIEYYE